MLFNKQAFFQPNSELVENGCKVKQKNIPEEKFQAKNEKRSWKLSSSSTTWPVKTFFHTPLFTISQIITTFAPDF